MTEPPEFRPNFLFIQARARLKDFFITSLWLSLMLAVLTGGWGVEGDALMLHLAAIFAVLFLCLFISFIVVCIVRKRHGGLKNEVQHLSRIRCRNARKNFVPTTPT